MASVHRKNGHWRATWRVEIDGKLKQRSKTFATRAEAQAHAREQERAFELRGVATVEELTATQLADRFLVWCETRLRISTAHGYKRNLDLLLRHVGTMQLRRITPEHMDLAYASLRKIGGAKGQPLHPRTVLHVHRVAHRMFGQAVKWRLIADNPARLASPPPVPPVRARAPTIEEAGRLIAAAQHEPWPQLLALALSTGLRRGELLGLSWDALDLDHGWLSVGQVVEQAGRTFALRAMPKTRTSARAIALDPSICTVLRAWRVRLAEQALALGVRWEPAALVFPNLKTGSLTTPYEPNLVSSIVGKLARRAGIPAGVAPLHGLRHRHATSLMHLPLRMVADRLGHSTVRITADLYQHGDEASARATADAAGVAFGAVVHLATRLKP